MGGANPSNKINLAGKTAPFVGGFGKPADEIFKQNVGRPASEGELSNLVASTGGDFDSFINRTKALGAQERQKNRSRFVNRSSFFGS